MSFRALQFFSLQMKPSPWFHSLLLLQPWVGAHLTYSDCVIQFAARNWKALLAFVSHRLQLRGTDCHEQQDYYHRHRTQACHSESTLYRGRFRFPLRLPRFRCNLFVSVVMHSKSTEPHLAICRLTVLSFAALKLMESKKPRFLLTFVQQPLIYCHDSEQSFTAPLPPDSARRLQFAGDSFALEPCSVYPQARSHETAALLS